MPDLSNQRAVHHDVHLTLISVIMVYSSAQTEIDVVIGACWTRECRGAWVEGAACVSHHAGQRNDSTTARCLVVSGVSRETNKICKSAEEYSDAM